MANTTLVLVPGLMCDHAVWSGVMAYLGSKAEGAVVPDHGLCDDIEGMAQKILASVPGLLAVAGHSMGGRVALEMRRLAPQRVRYLALLDTGYLARPMGAEGEAEAAKRQTLLDVALNQGVEAMARTWAQGMVHPSRLTDIGLMDAIVAMFARRTPQHFAAQIRALLARPDASQTLQSTAGPVYLLCGAQDTWSPVSQHQAMAKLLPQAVLSVIESAGHMAPMEQPAAVAQLLAEWLTSTPLVSEQV
jgi:pimeloyl-ACP methyl ester carboxylesterase